MTSPIPHEIEVKFYPVDVEMIRTKLQSVGAVCTHPMRQMLRVVFAKEDNPHLDVDYIRVRDEGNLIRVSTKEYADASKGIQFQRELDIEVNDFEKTVQLLEMTGLKRSTYQQTKREQWRVGKSEVCIDMWPHLKPYIEIESPSEQELRDTAKVLGMDWEVHINGGALRLYMKEHSWDKEEALKHVKRLLFDEPLQRIE